MDENDDRHVIVKDGRLVNVPLSAWLDDKERERDAVMMRLRQLEIPLIEHGRLRRESLSRRHRG